MRHHAWTVFAVVAVAACGSDNKQTGSETHWLSCQTSRDCNDGFVCSANRCLPQDEVGNNNAENNNVGTSNNVGANNTVNWNNGLSNNTTGSNNTNISVNNTTGSNNTTGTTGLCPVAGGPPVPVPIDAVTQVTFALTNNYATDIWVPDQGWFCDAWGIDGVSRNMGFQCGCECPNPGSPGVESFRRIAVGETLDIIWDGRELATYSECLDCSEWGSTEALSEVGGVLQPSLDGTYTFRISLVLDTPPAGCEDPTGTGLATCDIVPDGELPPEIAETCDVPMASLETAVEFTLDATAGPQVVAISLPN